MLHQKKNLCQSLFPHVKSSACAGLSVRLGWWQGAAIANLRIRPIQYLARAECLGAESAITEIT